MTAYAYVRKVKKDSRLEIVAKSFNSKYLDIAIYHLPPEKVILERKIRELIERNFSRGRIEMYIFIKSENTLQPAVNEKVLKSYSKYFNKKYKRKGPLWETRFKNVHVDTDEQLLHLTRYIHLNPVTALLVKKPEDWNFSSYKEYLRESPRKICEFEEFIPIEKNEYKLFVEERIDYQKELAKIKHLLLE